MWFGSHVNLLVQKLTFVICAIIINDTFKGIDDLRLSQDYTSFINNSSLNLIFTIF